MPERLSLSGHRFDRSMLRIECNTVPQKFPPTVCPGRLYGLVTR